MKTSMLEEYYNLCKKHKECIVLYQNGKFFEIFEWDFEANEESPSWYYGSAGYAKTVSSVLNMVLTRRNKNEACSYSNPNMVGFPIYKVEEHTKTLIVQGYKVVKYRQEMINNEFVRIFDSYVSPGLRSDGQSICMFIYFSSEIGISIVNTTTGEIKVGEMPKISDLHMYIKLYNPSEFIIFKESKREFPLDVYPKEIKETTKLSLEKKNQLLNSVWNLESQFLSPIEALHLEFYNNACECLSHTIIHLSDIYPTLLSELSRPVLLTERNTCRLHGNIINQLDIPIYFKYINFTKTQPGKQLLYHQLTHPCIDKKDIYKYHTDVIKIEENVMAIQNLLSKLVNLEILTKKISTKQISFQDLLSSYNNYVIAEQIDNIFENQQTTDMKSFFETFFTECSLNQTKYIYYYDCLSSLSNLEETLRRWANKWNCKLSEDYKLFDTPTRCKKLKEQLRTKLEMIETGSKNKCELVNKEILSIQHECTKIKTIIEENEKEILDEILLECYQNKTKFINLTKKVSYIDTILSRFLYSVQHKTVKPVILESDQGYVKGENVRHLVLQQSMETEYNGNEIDLKQGMLLYGLNGAGKSCYLKTMAVSVILAQSGFYVSADAFELCPFHDIFMRVDCDDDIVKNQSSFQVEMSEIAHIVEVSNERSLVLGDEILKSTEHYSANLLAAALIEHLHVQKAKYILATHLHDLHKLVDSPVYHIAAYIDSKKGEIVYERKLKEGPCDKVYGLTIGQHLVQNKQFNRLIAQLKAKKEKRFEKSKYNSKLLLIHCEICKSNQQLETHHIKPQAEYPTLSKQLSNLVCLCKECHLKVHQNILVIDKWTRTKNGKILTYYYSTV